MNQVVDTSYPFGNVPRHFTSDAFMSDKTEATLRFYMTIFQAHTGLTSKVFPLLAKTTQEHTVDATIIDVVPMVPHSHQALTATMLNRSRRATYRMVDHALSFTLDGSILNTSTGDFLASANTKALHSSVNLTMMISIMAELRKIPDFYSLYHKLLSITNVNRLEENVATEAQRDLEERTIGFLDGQGAGLEFGQNGITDPWHRVNASIDLFLRTADEVLHGLRVDGSLVPNFIMMSSGTARGIRVTSHIQDAPDPKSLKSINDFLHDTSGDRELTLEPQIPQLGELRPGIAIVTIVPHYSGDGLVNELETCSTFGMFHPIHAYEHTVKITVPDYAKRNNVEFQVSPHAQANITNVKEFKTDGSNGYTTVVFKANRTTLKAPNFSTGTVKLMEVVELLIIHFTAACSFTLENANNYVSCYYNSWTTNNSDVLTEYAPDEIPFYRLPMTGNEYSHESFSFRYAKIGNVDKATAESFIKAQSIKLALQLVFDSIAVFMYAPSLNQYIMPPSVNVKLTSGNNCISAFDVPVAANQKMVHLVRPMIRVNTDAIYYGIGGSETGNVLIGKSRIDEYAMPHNDRKEWRIQAMMGVAVYEPDHLIRVDQAKFTQYHSGADATVYGPADFKTVHTFNSNPSNQRRHSSQAASSKNMIFMGIPDKVMPPNSTYKFVSATTPITVNSVTPINLDNLSHHQQFSGSSTYCVTGPNIGVPYMLNLKAGGILFGNRYRAIADDVVLLFDNVSVAPTVKPVTCWRKKLQKITKGDGTSEATLTAANDSVISRGPFRYVSVSSFRDLCNGQSFTTCPAEPVK